MEKSENVSKILITSARKSGSIPTMGPLPFAGLGFDLSPVMTRRVVVKVVGACLAQGARRPVSDTPLPSGRRLQISLGREIRGR